MPSADRGVYMGMGCLLAGWGASRRPPSTSFPVDILALRAEGFDWDIYGDGLQHPAALKLLVWKEAAEQGVLMQETFKVASYDDARPASSSFRGSRCLEISFLSEGPCFEDLLCGCGAFCCLSCFLVTGPWIS